MKITLLIRSLGCGGAERQLLLMARELSARHAVQVMTFYDTDTPLQQIDAAVAGLITPLSKRSRWDVLGFLWRFLTAIRHSRPDVIYAFMGPPSLVALTARWACPGTRIVWGVRSSNVDLGRYGRLARLVRHAETRLSRFAHLIISNSVAGKEQALREGFSARRFTVIGNGIDTLYFRHRSVRAETRAGWGLADDVPVVGIVARLDPMKGYETFLHAVARVLAAAPEVVFVIAGDGAPDYAGSLRELARSLQVEGSLRWLGRIDDVTAVYSAIDIATSSSLFGEGFSNAVGEAMACALPCVVTDVGDAARIVGDTGLVVPAGDAPALAEAWLRLLRMPAAERAHLAARAQRRVEENFSVEIMVRATEAALAEVVVS